MSTINGLKFRQMLVAGANRLEVQKKLVDEMNVFPVPDGDTGTNMSLTVTSAVKEVMAVSSDSVSDIAKQRYEKFRNIDKVVLNDADK